MTIEVNKYETRVADFIRRNRTIYVEQFTRDERDDVPKTLTSLDDLIAI